MHLTIAWGLHGEIYYALEGSVFVAGSAIQWLRDQMKFFPKASMSQEFAERADPDNGVFLVPAFTGLGAPYWDDRCRGALFGITRGTTREDITKATLDSLCYQTRDVLEAMEQDAGICIKHLKVDGGASANDYLMQFQSDLLQCRIIRPHDVETTALGAARLAGLALHYWTMNDFEQAGRNCVEYAPKADKQRMDGLYAKWKQAVASARMFSD